MLFLQLSSLDVDTFVLLTMLHPVTAKEVGLRIKEPGIRYETVYAELCRHFVNHNLTRDCRRRVTLPQNSQQITPAEWRRFMVELLSTLAKGMENESSVREH